MITKDNLRGLLTCLGFQQSETVQDEMHLYFNNIKSTVAVDFTNEKIIYPEGVQADRDTTKNFSANENFVVLECVIGLFAQGYKPENIVLEPKTPGGREDSHFYCDILIRDNDNRPYMLIERLLLKSYIIRQIIQKNIWDLLRGRTLLMDVY